MPMKEVLFALAAIANIASFALMLWQEYKHRRMEREERGD